MGSKGFKKTLLWKFGAKVVIFCDIRKKNVFFIFNSIVNS